MRPVAWKFAAVHGDSGAAGDELERTCGLADDHQVLVANRVDDNVALVGVVQPGGGSDGICAGKPCVRAR